MLIKSRPHHNQKCFQPNACVTKKMNTEECVPPNLQVLIGYVVIHPKWKGGDKVQDILVDLISYH